VSGKLADFAAGLADRPWFVRCGLALDRLAIDDARLWLVGLGFGAAPVAGVTSWREASRLIQGPDWSRAWWDAETAQAESLRRAAYAVLGEKACLEALTDVTEAAAALRDRAAAALARAGLDDETLAKVAAGAAAQACHQRGLALLAGTDDSHAFAAKFRLFAAGRWPLGIVGETCFVF
jgi:hypothetical protein